jgi:hypothetical protein
MNNRSKAGVFITGSHSTMTEHTEKIVKNCAMNDPHTTRIVLGVIEKTKKGVGGKFRVKLTDVNGAVNLQIRSNYYVQEVWVYTDNIQTTRTNLAKYAVQSGFAISFGGSERTAH